MSKPICYECKWRRECCGSCHSRCIHPDAGGDRNEFAAMVDLFIADSPGQKGAEKLNIRANPHGVRHGWFCWPGNFDPVWLENCDGFESKEAKNEGATKSADEGVI